MYDSTLSLLVDVRVGGFIYVTSSERISLPWRWEIEEKMSGGKKEVGRGGEGVVCFSSPATARLWSLPRQLWR